MSGVWVMEGTLVQAAATHLGELWYQLPREADRMCANKS